MESAAGPAAEHTSVGEVGAVSTWREPWRGTKPKEEPGAPKAATSKGYNGLVDGVKPRGWLPSGPSTELLLAAGLCEEQLVEQRGGNGHGDVMRLSVRGNLRRVRVAPLGKVVSDTGFCKGAWVEGSWKRGEPHGRLQGAIDL